MFLSYDKMRDGRSARSRSRSNPVAEVLIPRESPGSTGKHVVIVMDATKEFSTKPLQWALDFVVEVGWSVTLIGVMPWVPFPCKHPLLSHVSSIELFIVYWSEVGHLLINIYRILVSCNIRLDVWRHILEDMQGQKGIGEWINDPKHHKIHEIVEACKQKRVVPCMKLAMGHPLKLVVLEQITSIHATFVVLERHLRKHKAFLAERLPSSAVMMNRHGGVDVIRMKARSDGELDSTTAVPGESPATVVPTPEVILSQELLGRLRRQTSI
ncbi:hypothetical protein LINPERHAP1_LOCUS35159 [Linum perenne]